MYTVHTLFSKTGLFIAVYLIIGIAVNTAAPHIPGTSYPSLAIELHSWAQYIISVLFWPLSFWSPNFTTGKWTG